MLMNVFVRKLFPVFASALAVLGVAFTSGCGTLPGGRGWGQDAIWPVQWKRIPQAAKNAVLDPATWIPAAGAAVFAIDDWDHKVANWASERTPVFGSRGTADDASDYLRDAVEAEVFLTGVLTPSGDEPWGWAWAKARGLGVEYSALWLNNESTGWIKDGVGRRRPDRSGHDSFPSGHASGAFAAAHLSNRNLDSIQMKPWLRRTIQAGNFTLAGGAAWARVEAGRHYPSDVLAGAALGNFISTFIHDAFLNLPETSTLKLRVEPSPKSLMVGLSWDF